MIIDREEIFAERIERFKDIIRHYQQHEVELVNQKARDQQQAERNKILKQSHEKDENFYHKKEKTLQTQIKIMKSRKINESRMSKMKLRHQLIERIQEDIKKSLTDKINDQRLYRQLLKKLIIQGLIKMLEQNVEVKCLKRDVALIKQLAPQCEKEFNQMSSIHTKITVNERQNLSENDLGGIYVTSNNGRIVCNNTLAARLQYSTQRLLPQIREILFFNQHNTLV